MRREKGGGVESRRVRRRRRAKNQAGNAGEVLL